MGYYNCVPLFRGYCALSFFVSFQSNIKSASPSNNQWIELINPILPSKELTICLWFKAQYFNIDVAINLWSYCTVKSKGDEMRCLQTWLSPLKESANKDVVVKMRVPWDEEMQEFSMKVRSFIHRSWAHFCWSLSSITGIGKLYYNGTPLGVHSFHGTNNKTVIGNSRNVFDAAFIFGQEPDTMRGSYDKYQAFIGDLTEMNLWNIIMDDAIIKEMAQCNDWTKGNLVAWKRHNFKTNNVKISDLNNADSLCAKEERFVIFPQRVLHEKAIETCLIHGGVK